MTVAEHVAESTRKLISMIFWYCSYRDICGHKSFCLNLILNATKTWFVTREESNILDTSQAMYNTMISNCNRLYKYEWRTKYILDRREYYGDKWWHKNIRNHFIFLRLGGRVVLTLDS